jgi:hypothetical protein
MGTLCFPKVLISLPLKDRHDFKNACMKTFPLKPVIWPERPAGFDDNGLALILLTLPAGTQRADAKQLARAVLRECLDYLLTAAHIEPTHTAQMSPFKPAMPAASPQPSPALRAGEQTNRCASFTLIESPCGPLIAGISADIKVSLSYAGEKVLIGISCGHALGVDIVLIDRFPEIEALSRLYLPTTPLDDAGFSLAWAQMEACCKCLGLPLAEIDEGRERAYSACDLPDCHQVDGYRMAVAVEQKQLSRALSFDKKKASESGA